MAKFTNRLSQETSPYLLQHAHNPVDWFPWCEEALERSRTENKMIFLSIGYSSCHWCHVMERESFEDESVARFLNDNFVCIKVDREERPDIDAIYMDAVQLISRHGGWPLNVWLTPTLAPLYGGTYFPPEPSHQRPSFMMVLQRLLQVWREEPEKVFKQTQEITEALSTDLFERNESQFSAIDHQQLADFLRRAYEPQFGGFSAAPKFPMPMTIRLAFILGRNQEFSYLNNRALRTLDAMRLGGIWDHVGGGFSRYSVDDSWTVPHFEKMLYDNAQLLHCYLDAWQVSGKTHYLDVAKGIIEFLEREMKDSFGLFYCALDADSEGEEGKFYVWSELELKQILSEEEFNLISEYWEISGEGNFEGNIIPRFQRRKFDHLSDISDKIFEKLNPIQAKLLQEREKRIRPGLDAKMLCSWNAMLLISLSRMGQLLGGDWIYKAKELGESMIAEFWNENQLFRIKTNGKISQKAFLDDYALFIVGLTNLWQITQNDTYLEFAKELKSQMIERFYNSEKQRFFFSGTHHEEIIARKVDIFDNAVPGGLGSALAALISLNKINPDSRIQQIISQQISLAGEMAVHYPLSCSFLLQAMIDWYEESKEIVVFGEKSEEFRAIWRKHFDTFNVAIFHRQNESSHELVQGKVAENGETLAWICHHFSCDAPISNLTEFSYTIGA